jgi:hypothetical protein
MINFCCFDICESCVFILIRRFIRAGLYGKIISRVVLLCASRVIDVRVDYRAALLTVLIDC